MTRTNRFMTSNYPIKTCSGANVRHISRTSISWIYLFEVIERVDAVLAHFRDESDASDEDPVILFGDQTAGGRQEHLHQLRHASYNPKGAERRFLPDVRVRRLHQSLHLGRQIPCHFRRRDRTEGTQRQTNDELRGTVQVTMGTKRRMLSLFSENVEYWRSK